MGSSFNNRSTQAQTIFSGPPDSSDDWPTSSETLQKPDASGRLVKWSVELSEFDLSYKSRGAIKAQALADFIVDRMEPRKGVQEEQPAE